MIVVSHRFCSGWGMQILFNASFPQGRTICSKDQIKTRHLMIEQSTLFWFHFRICLGHNHIPPITFPAVNLYICSTCECWCTTTILFTMQLNYSFSGWSLVTVPKVATCCGEMRWMEAGCNWVQNYKGLLTGTFGKGRSQWLWMVMDIGHGVFWSFNIRLRIKMPFKNRRGQRRPRFAEQHALGIFRSFLVLAAKVEGSCWPGISPSKVE